MDLLNATLISLGLGFGGDALDVDPTLTLTVTHDTRQVFCRGDQWVGRLSIEAPLSKHFFLVYDHESCLAEENDLSTSDRVGIGFRMEFDFL